ncbi:MAG: type VI secretion system baseplate subunit TssE [Cellvibrionaceae bacterium]|nr:type VI secretion system baseplate subunit TssE [Cellvibrionaceae bacterium]
MTTARKDQPILPSLLDRLIDHDPSIQDTPVKSYRVVLTEIKDSIRRDLENLLNTRLYRKPLPEELTELDISIVNYGLPDFSMLQVNSDDGKHEFKEKVQSIIEKYEPRFKSVTVDLEHVGEHYERTLYMKISAVLMIEPDPIPLMFDSRVKTMDKSVILREINHG